MKGRIPMWLVMLILAAIALLVMSREQVAIFLSDADADFDTRNAAVIALSEAVMQVVTSR